MALAVDTSARKQHDCMRFRDTALIALLGSTPVLVTVYPEGLMDRMTVAITETGAANALDAFTVAYMYHPSGGWITVASAGADYTTPNDPVIKASGDLTALLTNTSGWAILDIRGAYGVRFAASGAVGNATLTIEGSAQ